MYYKHHVADGGQHVVVCSLLLVPSYQLGTPVLATLAKFSTWGRRRHQLNWCMSECPSLQLNLDKLYVCIFDYIHYFSLEQPFSKLKDAFCSSRRGQSHDMFRSDLRPVKIHRFWPKQSYSLTLFSALRDYWLTNNIPQLSWYLFLKFSDFPGPHPHDLVLIQSQTMEHLYVGGGSLIRVWGMGWGSLVRVCG